MALVLNGFVEQMTTNRTESLKKVIDVAEELEQKYKNFLAIKEEAEHEMSSVIKHFKELEEQIVVLDEKLTNETDIKKAKRLLSEKNEIINDLDLVNKIIDIKKRDIKQKLFDSGIDVLTSANTYSNSMSDLTKLLETTANSLTIKSDIKAVYDMERYAQNIKSTVGEIFVELGLMEKGRCYIRVNGTSYNIRPYTYFPKAKNLEALEKFFNSDDFKHGMYGLKQNYRGG